MLWTPQHRIGLVNTLRKREGGDRSLDMETALYLEARESLASFIQQTWHVLQPSNPLVWRAEYLHIICNALEDVTRRFEAGLPSRVVICLPPGCMKSFLVSVFWPAWWWLRKPDLAFLNFGGSERLTRRHSGRMRDLVMSEWYKRMVAAADRLGHTEQWGLPLGSGSLSFENSATGLRDAFALGGSPLGHRAHGMITDDPVQIKHILGSKESVGKNLDDIYDVIESGLSTRTVDPWRVFEVLIMQRLHIDDPAGRWMERGPTEGLSEDGFKILNFSMWFDPDDPHNHPDDRREKGQLLAPSLYPGWKANALYERLNASTPGQGDAQLRQRPVPPGGSVFLKEWMSQIYEHRPQHPRNESGAIVPYDEIALTIDCNLKKGKRTDQTSIQAWARHGFHSFYLLGETTRTMSPMEMEDETRKMITEYQPRLILIEEKAGGYALIDRLKSEFGNRVVPFEPDKHGDKEKRAQLIYPEWRGGTVWLPQGRYMPTLGQWKTEVLGFPHYTYDDRVDAMVQLFIYWREMAGGLGRDLGREADAGMAALDILAGGGGGIW